MLWIARNLGPGHPALAASDFPINDLEPNDETLTIPDLAGGGNAPVRIDYFDRERGSVNGGRWHLHRWGRSTAQQTLHASADRRRRKPPRPSAQR